MRKWVINIEFSRVGKHTIKCTITEDEIHDLGYSVEEIVTNGERTQEFMNHIFDMAEEEFETKFDMGVKTVQVEFHSDHTLSLTFSEHPFAGGMMEHLKDIVNGIMNSIPQQKWEEMQKQSKEKSGGEPKEEPVPTDILVMLKFADLDTVIRFAKQVPDHLVPVNALYKDDQAYYLSMDMSDFKDQDAKCLSILTDEYVTDIQVGRERLAHLKEMTTTLLGEKAIESLKQL